MTKKKGIKETRIKRRKKMNEGKKDKWILSNDKRTNEKGLNCLKTNYDKEREKEYKNI